MFDSSKGSSRERIGLDELRRDQANGTVMTDDRRRRPLWFDGRFLDANTLKSEQNYFLARQADIAYVAGMGVVNGLKVGRVGDKSRTLVIHRGHGITPSGESVIIPEDTQVDLANVSGIQELNARFGLSELPKQSFSNRSGLFILGLRAVEFTANPISAYPTSINGSRSTEDSEIIEATAITLIPYPDRGARADLSQRRMSVAREIFIDESKKGEPIGVLPLAMIALNLGVIQWLDMHMVRREAGRGDQDIFGLGLSPRALREAYLRQYHEHLSELLENNGSGSRHITASDYFAALPAAGPMPATTIDASDFTQSYFPAEMDVDLSIIPRDELPALIEDSYALPPINLTGPDEAFESTSILVLLPVPRTQLRHLAFTLKSLIRPLVSAGPVSVAKRRPITALANLSLRRLSRTTPAVENPSESLWRQTLNGVDTLWYIRRRNISYKESVVSEPVSLDKDEMEIEEKVLNQLEGLGLKKALTNIKRRGSTLAEGEIMKVLSSPVLFEGSGTVVKAVLDEINRLKRVDRASVLKIAERFTAPGFGEGIARLEKAQADFTADKKVAKSIADSGRVPELDHLVRRLKPAELARFSEELLVASKEGLQAEVNVAKLIDDKIAALDAKPTALSTGIPR